MIAEEGTRVKNIPFNDFITPNKYKYGNGSNIRRASKCNISQ